MNGLNLKTWKCPHTGPWAIRLVQVLNTARRVGWGRGVFLDSFQNCIFRDAKLIIQQVPKGFWLDPHHLALHFEHLTESPPLDKNIKEHLSRELGMN